MKFRISSVLLLSLALSSEAFVPQHMRPTHAFGLRMAETQEAVVKRLPDSAVEIEIPVPGSATKAAYDKVCSEVSKNIQIPGFRKGSKIPAQVLEQAMAAKGGRNAMKVQAINELTNQLLEPTLKEQALDPIGQPTFIVPAEDLAEKFVAGEPLKIAVKCDVWPDIQWKQIEGKEKPYLGLKGAYTRKPFNQERLDRAVRDLKERYATNEPIEDKEYQLQMGDSCTVNMEGFMATRDGGKGEPLPNAASGDRVEVILGPGRYMEGLVEGLVGAKVGETRTVTVSFPEKLRDKSLAGKKAVFDVEVLEAARRIIPEITDEFANKVRAGLTEESLMAELRKAIDTEDAKEFMPARNKALGEALAKVMDVEVPDTLVTNQARDKFAMMMAEMRDNGVADEEIKKQINPENLAKYKDIVKGDIINEFKVSMAVDEIARMEGIDIPAYQVEEQIEAVKKEAAEAGEDQEIDEKMLRAKVESTLQRNAVMDWLAENAQLEVSYENDDFDERLMQELADESLKREEELAAKAGSPAVVDATVVGEPPKEEVSSRNESGSSSTKPKAEINADKYAGMSLEEKAFQILVDTGAVEQHKSPDDPDYDHSTDDEVA